MFIFSTATTVKSLGRSYCVVLDCRDPAFFLFFQIGRSGFTSNDKAATRWSDGPDYVNRWVMRCWKLGEVHLFWSELTAYSRDPPFFPLFQIGRIHFKFQGCYELARSQQTGHAADESCDIAI
jgi:hypothetical protein